MSDPVIKFKTKRLLTRPVLKFVLNTPRYLKFETAMHLGKKVESRNPVPEDKKKEPATLADVIDLETGESAQIIISAVVKGVLMDEYPNDAYVGLCFAITKLPRTPGKQYDAFRVEEIESPAGGEVDSVETKSGKRK